MASRTSSIASTATDRGQIAGSLDAKAKADFDSATAAFEAANAKILGHLQRVQGILVAEKSACNKLADVIEAKDKSGKDNWKGKDKADAKLAADAMRAMPIAQRILSTIDDVNKSIAKELPSETTRSQHGHTLATKGRGAPGDAAVKETAGWILGAVAPMAAERERWQAIVGRMQLVASSLGVV